ncbi:PREDICTED: leukocyte receptor cluster member 9-like [Priapulus caudatus]|uniref:Leukocyte receptor cluster member 9-like n=1 Tax=Priapulus caudatus TaxID=37621 RepID=A0ABM1EJC6_PRICU|nr:PREDICTED: leukocyte receptor cluster member 9-like [Priapulus caudatus]
MPVITFTCTRLAAPAIAHAQRHLEALANERRGKPTMREVIAAAVATPTNAADETDRAATSPASRRRRKEKKPKRKKKEKGKGREEEEETSAEGEKKPRMKTAADCVSRVRWDARLAEACFVVGYVDRFVGVVERPFSHFCWGEDLASVDDVEELAVPQHRIQYFKYRGLKVWDKSERLDLMFGSTGDTRDLHDAIAAYDALHPDDEEGATDSDDSDDEDFGDGGGNAKFTLSQATADVRYDLSDRPNYFVAVHVTNPEVIAKVTAIQADVRAYDPRLAEGFLHTGALHVTLAMLRLDGPDDVRACQVALRAAPRRLRRFLAAGPLALEFPALATFNQRVLYAATRRDERFLAFVQELQDHLLNNGVRVHHSLDYVPHLTVMKMSRPLARRLGTYYVDQRAYESRAGDSVGGQTCDRMYLCEISEMRNADGFYRHVTSVGLLPGDVDNDNDGGDDGTIG